MFNELIIIIELEKSDFTFKNLLGAILLGLGIQFIFHTINGVPNLASEIIVLILLNFFIISGAIIEMKYFFSKKPIIILQEEKVENNKLVSSRVHMSILGILFIMNAIWVINPFSLAAYGLYTLPIPSSVTIYGNGFIVIITTLEISYVLTQFLIKIRASKLVILSLILQVIFILINHLSLFFLDTNVTTSLFVFYIIGSGISIILLIFYYISLFNTYMYYSRKKLLLGLNIFLIGSLFFIFSCYYIFLGLFLY